MLSAIVTQLLRHRVPFVFLLIAALPSAGNLQTGEDGSQTRIEAFSFLRQIGQRYANAAVYHIEAVTEEQGSTEFSKNWTKSMTTSISSLGNKYRFEAHSNWENWMLVSDGKSEWLYSPTSREYKKQIVPANGPSRFESSGLRSFQALTEAQDAIKNLANLPLSVRAASYLPDEILTLSGKKIDCYVIDAQGKYRPGGPPDANLHITIWIDKEHHFVRKLRKHTSGQLIISRPAEEYESDETTIYPVVELDAEANQDSFFDFAPPADANLVKEFGLSAQIRRDALLVGKAAPDVRLDSLDGRSILLSSFHGKSVLLDFWATWCAPCVAAMPAVSRLNREASKLGLILLSIDEDDDARKATDFLSKHGEPWPNFHDDGEIVRQFPNEGIPHFVLINSLGRIVFSKSTFDEAAIRAAIAGLGPEFTSIAKPSAP